MADPTTPNPQDGSKGDETFAWTQPSPASRAASGSAGATATTILDSVRDAVDEFAVRAAPSVREFSARAAEFAASAADRAAPFAKRAGEVTADASGRLATMSRSWAADLRAPVATSATDAQPTETSPGSTTESVPAPTEGTRPSEPS